MTSINCNTHTWKWVDETPALFNHKQKNERVAIEFVIHLFKELNANTKLPLELPAKLIYQLNLYNWDVNNFCQMLNPKEFELIHSFIGQLCKTNEDAWKGEAKSASNKLSALAVLVSYPMKILAGMQQNKTSDYSCSSKDNSFSLLFYHAMACKNPQIAVALLDNIDQLASISDLERHAEKFHYELLFLSVSAIGAIGKYPLEYAILKGWCPLAAKLIERQQNVNRHIPQGFCNTAKCDFISSENTLLDFVLCRAFSLEEKCILINELIKKGVDIFYCNDNFPVLFYYLDELTMIDLLQKRKTPLSMNKTHLVIHAMNSDKYQLAAALLEAGVSPEAVRCFKQSAPIKIYRLIATLLTRSKDNRKIINQIIVPKWDDPFAILFQSIRSSLTKIADPMDLELVSSKIAEFLIQHRFSLAVPVHGYYLIENLVRDENDSFYPLLKAILLKLIQHEDEQSRQGNPSITAYRPNIPILLANLLQSGCQDMELIQKLMESGYSYSQETIRNYIKENLACNERAPIVHYLATDCLHLRSPDDPLLINALSLGDVPLLQILTRHLTPPLILLNAMLAHSTEGLENTNTWTVMPSSDELFSAWFYSLSKQRLATTCLIQDPAQLRALGFKLLPLEQLAQTNPKIIERFECSRSTTERHLVDHLVATLLDDGQEHLLKILIEEHILPVNFTDAEGNTVLHLFGNKLIEWYQTYSTNQPIQNVKEKFLYGSMIEALLQQGANPFLKNKEGLAPEIFTNAAIPEDFQVKFLERVSASFVAIACIHNGAEQSSFFDLYIKKALEQNKLWLAETLVRISAPYIPKEVVFSWILSFWTHSYPPLAQAAFQYCQSLSEDPEMVLSLLRSDLKGMSTILSHLPHAQFIRLMTMSVGGMLFYEVPEAHSFFRSIAQEKGLFIERKPLSIQKSNVYEVSERWLKRPKQLYSYPTLSMGEFDTRACRLKKEVITLWKSLRWSNQHQDEQGENQLDPKILIYSRDEILQGLTIILDKIINRTAWLGTSPAANHEQVFAEYSVFLMDFEAVLAGIKKKDKLFIAGYLVDIAEIELTERCFTGYAEEMLQKRNILSGRLNDLKAKITDAINQSLFEYLEKLARFLEVHAQAQYQHALGLRPNGDHLASLSLKQCINQVKNVWNTDQFIAVLDNKLTFEEVSEWLMQSTPGDFSFPHLRLRAFLQNEEAKIFHETQRKLDSLGLSIENSNRINQYVYESRAQSFHFAEQGEFHYPSALRDIIHYHLNKFEIPPEDNRDEWNSGFVESKLQETIQGLRSRALKEEPTSDARKKLLSEAVLLEQTLYSLKKEMQVLFEFYEKFKSHHTGSELKEILKIKQSYDQQILKLSSCSWCKDLNIEFSLIDHARPSIACERARCRAFNGAVLGDNLEALSVEEIESLPKTALIQLLRSCGILKSRANT